MKKRNLKSLALNKKSISNLNSTGLNGGLAGFTSGCTDGCGPLTATMWNCTEANCTADCDTFVCDTNAFCTYDPGAANPMPHNPNQSPVKPNGRN